MNDMRCTMVVLAIGALWACKPKPPAQSLADVGGNNGGSTVYDDPGRGGAGGRGGADDLESDIVERDIYTPTIQDESIDDIQTLESTDYASMDLDWSPIFFGFDDSSLSEEAKQQLAERAAMLRAQPGLHVLLEGHCDMRGTEDYNLALGERRAQAVKRYLEQLGVPGERLRTMSYGEMRPLVASETEAAWARNRRVAFTF